MKPHKHAEVIKAWADGVEIQMKYTNSGWVDWKSGISPYWNKDEEYRIKPQPKDNIVKFINVRLNHRDKEICRWDSCDEQYANLKLVFDGDTGEIKLAEVLK